ncbi:hypothetical protein ACQJBY_047939 [Aegilops geniculata]
MEQMTNSVNRWLKIYEVGGLSASYEHASRIHERPIVTWLWSAGCRLFRPSSNSSLGSQTLQDVAQSVRCNAAQTQSLQCKSSATTVKQSDPKASGKVQGPKLDDGSGGFHFGKGGGGDGGDGGGSNRSFSKPQGV